MNKFVALVLFTVFLVASGVVYQVFYRPAEVAPVAATGRVVNIHMRSVENQWRWDPNVISAVVGDRVILTITNEDPYDHGFAIEAFGVNKRVFAKRDTVVDFVVSKPGTFSFYCSVPCGEGHYQQVGRFTSGAGDTGSSAACSSPRCHRDMPGALVVRPPTS